MARSSDLNQNLLAPHTKLVSPLLFDQCAVRSLFLYSKWSLSVLLNWTFFLLRLDLLRFFSNRKSFFQIVDFHHFKKRAVTDRYSFKWPLVICYLFVCFPLFYAFLKVTRNNVLRKYDNFHKHFTYFNNIKSILYKSRCLVQ